MKYDTLTNLRNLYYTSSLLDEIIIMGFFDLSSMSWLYSEKKQ